MEYHNKYKIEDRTKKCSLLTGYGYRGAKDMSTTWL